MSDNKKCIVLEHKNLAKGWGCCQCKTYNGEQRFACKHCRHPRCESKVEVESIETSSIEDKSKLN